MYLIYNRHCLAPVMLWDREVTKTISGRYKAIKVPPKLEKTVTTLFNKAMEIGDQKSISELMTVVLKGRSTKGRHTRNTRSEKFLQDKKDAILYVIEKGAKVSRAAARYNLNPSSLSKWCSEYRKVNNT